MSPLEEVQGEFEVQVGAEAPQHQVAAHFPDEGGVGLAIQGDVAEDVLAAADPVLDVGMQVAVNVFVVWEVIQGELDKWQRAYDFLRETQNATPSLHGNFFLCQLHFKPDSLVFFQGGFSWITGTHCFVLKHVIG